MGGAAVCIVKVYQIRMRSCYWYLDRMDKYERNK